MEDDAAFPGHGVRAIEPRTIEEVVHVGGDGLFRAGVEHDVAPGAGFDGGAESRVFVSVPRVEDEDFVVQVRGPVAYGHEEGNHPRRTICRVVGSMVLRRDEGEEPRRPGREAGLPCRSVRIVHCLLPAQTSLAEDNVVGKRSVLQLGDDSAGLHVVLSLDEAVGGDGRQRCVVGGFGPFEHVEVVVVEGRAELSGMVGADGF